MGMNIKDQLTRDLKTAMLSGDKELTTTLRGLKSAILYAEVAKGTRDTGLSDTEIIDLFSKEAKKRQESADLYKQGGNHQKADSELAEKRVIEQYLPAQATDEEIASFVDIVEQELGGITKEQMGQAIGKVKMLAGSGADGARIAAAVKARIASA